MQPVLKELMSVKGLILLIALVALGLSITAVVGGGCGSSFGNTQICNQVSPNQNKPCGGLENNKKKQIELCQGDYRKCDKYGDGQQEKGGNDCKCVTDYGGGSSNQGDIPRGVQCDNNDECMNTIDKCLLNRMGVNVCQPPAGEKCIEVDKPCQMDKDTCCYNKETGIGYTCIQSADRPRGEGTCAVSYSDDDDDNSQPLPPIHPPGFGPQGSPPFPSKKGGGMLGGGGSTLGGSTIGGDGGLAPPPPGTEGGFCGKTALRNVKCESRDLKCNINKLGPNPSGTCVKKSSGCAKAGDPCGPMSGANCCNYLNCKIKEGDNRGIGQCVHSGGFNPSPPGPSPPGPSPPGPSPPGSSPPGSSPPGSPTGSTDGLPEWAVYSLLSAGGVVLVAIVIYLIMQMQSGKVN
jgi:hypothetical protein